MEAVGLKKLPVDIALQRATLFRSDLPGINGILGTLLDSTGVPYSPFPQSQNEKGQISLRENSYLPTLGDQDFRRLSSYLLYGNNHRKSIVAQTPGGTGALMLCLKSLILERKQQGRTSPISVITNIPGWSLYESIVGNSGANIVHFKSQLSANGMRSRDRFCEFLGFAPKGSVILEQPSCHNPTGTNFSHEDWSAIAAQCKRRNHIMIFDIAYQGLGSDWQSDIRPLEIFVKSGIEHLVAYSFSKNAGLYGQRIGFAARYCLSASRREIYESHFSFIASQNWLSPPRAGSEKVVTLLSSNKLRNKWHTELATMRQHLTKIRYLLSDLMKEVGIDGSYIESGNGLFTLLPLSTNEVNYLMRKWNILVHPEGARLSISAVGENNFDYFRHAFLDTKNFSSRIRNKGFGEADPNSYKNRPFLSSRITPPGESQCTT